MARNTKRISLLNNVVLTSTRRCSVFLSHALCCDKLILWWVIFLYRLALCGTFLEGVKFSVVFMYFSVPQIEYPLGGSSKNGSHVCVLLQDFWVILLFDINVVLLLPWWPNVTKIQSDVTVLVPWQLPTGSIHDYLYCYCLLVGIVFEVMIIDGFLNFIYYEIKYEDIYYFQDPENIYWLNHIYWFALAQGWSQIQAWQTITVQLTCCQIIYLWVLSDLIVIRMILMKCWFYQTNLHSWIPYIFAILVNSRYLK